VKRDERVVLAIRPEAIHMEEGIKRNANGLTGKVEKVTFEGNNVRYDVRLENQDLLVVVQPSLTDSWFDVEQKVALSFEPEKHMCFPILRQGSKKKQQSNRAKENLDTNTVPGTRRTTPNGLK
jgi:ABC-type Fe3+/spermidine/putrescine transport system ATPase subunit